MQNSFSMLIDACSKLESIEDDFSVSFLLMAGMHLTDIKILVNEGYLGLNNNSNNKYLPLSELRLTEKAKNRIRGK
jgi:hypothetical protein